MIAGCFSPDGELTLTEIHRFTNRPSRLGTHFYWDFPALYEEMIEGLRLAVAAGFEILSVGVDTWGVDFGLVCADGSLSPSPTAIATRPPFHTPNALPQPTTPPATMPKRESR